jgi:hypothetical protein
MAIPRKLRNASSSPSSPAPATGNSTASQSGSKGVPNWIIPLGIAYLVIRGLTIIAKIYIGFWDWILILGLAVVAIINLLSGKQKSISLITIIAIGCILWGNDHNIKSNTSEQSAGQQEQGGSSSTTPTPEAQIARERIAQIPGKVFVLTKSKTITLPPGQKDICFSWLGYNTNGDRVNQQLTIGGVQFSTQGSNCFPVEMEGEVEVKFLNPPQTEVDTYKIIREKGGQGEYPFIKLTK